MPTLSANDTVEILDGDFIYSADVNEVSGDNVSVWITHSQCTTIPICSIISVNGVPVEK